MPKMTKAQQKRMLDDILKKAGKLSGLRGMNYGGKPPLDIKDVIAIEKIVMKGLNRLK
tara:strand:- start:3736 stop:3909 length:174 start_codon:yes stop_codon:yes gene_type:complete